MNRLESRQHLLVCNTITCNGQPANSLDIYDLIDAVFLESWRCGDVIGTSDIYKRRRTRCWEKFALSTLAVRGSINIAPDPGLAWLDRALEDTDSSSGDGLIEMVSLKL